jgi:hypothetical protein
MTNRLAIFLLLAIVGGIAVDLTMSGGANLLFLGKELFALIDWLAFWR